MRKALLGALPFFLLLPGLLLLSCAGATPSPVDSSVPPLSDQQVMVTYPPAPPAIWAQRTQEIAQNYRLGVVYSWTMASIGEQCVVFQIPRGRSAESVARHLSTDPRVGSAQVIATFHTQGAAGDPYAHLQHSAQALRLDQAHKLATGKGVRVAVVDTGVDIDHPDLLGRVITARSFVDRGDKSFTTDIHGTAVAGLIAAAQRVEHYEIAGYGCVRTYAQQLGDDQAAVLLQQTLDEEGMTDKKLTQLAEQVINLEAER